jgi:hypothetical protein
MKIYVMIILIFVYYMAMATCFSREYRVINQPMFVSNVKSIQEIRWMRAQHMMHLEVHLPPVLAQSVCDYE